MNKTKMQTYIASRILLTIAYTEQFSFPLNKKELYSRLLVDFFVDLKSFNESVSFLKSKNFLKDIDGYFFITGLSDKKMVNLIKIRKKRAEFAVKKWVELEEFVNFAKHIPFITGIAVTGSLSMNNTVKEDDIDFMIVTTPNRLWITRLIVVLYSSLKGKRRSFAKEEINSWCFNLWVEETDLQLPVNSRSVYESYEVIQAVWVLSRNNVASRFRKLNRWTKKFVYLSSFVDEKVGGVKFSQSEKNIFELDDVNLNSVKKFSKVDNPEKVGGVDCDRSEKNTFQASGVELNSVEKLSKVDSFFKKSDWSNKIFLLSEFLYLLNWVAFYSQYLYMKPHMTREKVTKSHAFFHPRDTKSVVFGNWRKVVRRLQFVTN